MTAKTTGRPADYIGDMSQLDMVLDARKVLAREGATDREWAANTALITRYSNGAWTAQGRGPAVKVGTVTPTPDADLRPAEYDLPRGTGNSTSRRAAAPSGPAASDAQKDLIKRLVNDNITDDDTREGMLAAIPTLTKTAASTIITALLDEDTKRKDTERTTTRRKAADLDATLPAVPDGRYRVSGRNVRVNTGTGIWTGRIFIDELDAHGEKLRPIRQHTDKLAITTEIAADPHACVIAFGKATGACGRCDTPLEDPESIARGIGPYCEARSLGITPAQVYADRKRHPVAKGATPAPAPAAAAEINEPSPAPAPQTPATPTPPAAADVTLTAAEIDAMTFAQVMTYAKQLKVPGRGTARLPQLRAGVKAALALAA